MTATLPILNATQHPHEKFAAARELESRLRAAIQGEVRFVRRRSCAVRHRRLQLPPGADRRRPAARRRRRGGDHRGLPRTWAQRSCRAARAPASPASAAMSPSSSTSRNTCAGLFRSTRNSRVAVVEPGIVLDRVREAAEQHHLTFAPDPATHSRCTIGGMIGNNSCGTHSVMGGLTANNIRSLEILLYDGTRMTVGATSDDEFAAIVARGGRPAADLRRHAPAARPVRGGNPPPLPATFRAASPATTSMNCCPRTRLPCRPRAGGRRRHAGDGAQRRRWT